MIRITPSVVEFRFSLITDSIIMRNISNFFGVTFSTNNPVKTVGLWDIGCEHNLPSNGGYPLSLNPSEVPPSTVPTLDCLSPLYQRVPIVIAVVQSSSREPYLLAVTHRGQCITALPTLEIQLGWRKRQRGLERRAYRWQIRNQSATVSGPVMEEMFTSRAGGGGKGTVKDATPGTGVTLTGTCVRGVLVKSIEVSETLFKHFFSAVSCVRKLADLVESFIFITWIHLVLSP